MGHRTVKRVPMDFDWPKNATWKGYLLPGRLSFPRCTACDGTGYSPEARAISETFYPHQIGGPRADRLAWHDKLGQAEVDNLIAEGRLGTWNPVDRKWESKPRSAAEVNELQGRPRGGIEHDAINKMILVRFRCEQLGIANECSVCEGNGDIATAELRAEQDAWEGSEPPEGVGWQLWETVSEGSPQSPVFATAQELAVWCEENATWFADYRWTAAQWLATFLEGTTDVASLLVIER